MLPYFERDCYREASEIPQFDHKPRVNKVVKNLDLIQQKRRTEIPYVNQLTDSALVST
jgi:hypothetical protein